jgi:CHAT domain-containing protein
LIERFSSVVALPSASFLSEIRTLRSFTPETPQADTKEILVIGDPLFGKDHPRLPASGAEARKVAGLTEPNNAVPLIGPDANIAKFQAAKPERFRNILFATHAIVDEKRPELSSIIFSEVDASGKPQDGALRLLDLYGADFHADLVFLSACETANGKDIPGEGLITLSRAFLSSGVKSVVATLWPVRDTATAQLVTSFFSKQIRRSNSSTTDAAANLRDTQLELWSKGQSPRKWAAFVVSGDPQ